MVDTEPTNERMGFEVSVSDGQPSQEGDDSLNLESLLSMVQSSVSRTRKTQKALAVAHHRMREAGLDIDGGGSEPSLFELQASRLKEVEREKVELQQTIDQLQQKIDRLKESESTLRESESRLQKEVGDLRAKLNSTLIPNEFQSCENAKAQEKCKELLSRNLELEEELHKVKSALSELQTLVSSLPNVAAQNGEDPTKIQAMLVKAGLGDVGSKHKSVWTRLYLDFWDRCSRLDEKQRQSREKANAVFETPRPAFIRHESSSHCNRASSAPIRNPHYRRHSCSNVHSDQNSGTWSNGSMNSRISSAPNHEQQNRRRSCPDIRSDQSSGTWEFSEFMSFMGQQSEKERHNRFPANSKSDRSHGRHSCAEMFKFPANPGVSPFSRDSSFGSCVRSNHDKRSF
eukprot:gnl/MRDRNA2_/MRDRNA2_235532_c0_seq1.p1 gnl/MRDRNA2_/MRDRNA2_235532_c0~~gnl/MRDRNA2_/MRDRNA2_235532_c0_seq1.p1  ORF type:complete len:401 (-),score=58.78 gnl/MRDRNA2_/MRDRNA2_235532_c0_seq1:169-1371(-)